MNANQERYVRQLEQRIIALEKRVDKVQRLSILNNNNLNSVANSLSRLAAQVMGTAGLRAALKRHTTPKDPAGTMSLSASQRRVNPKRKGNR